MSVTIFRPDTGDSLTFDSSREFWAPTVRVTEHPIEDGSSIVDHAQTMPLIYRVQGTITETPFDPAEEGAGGPERVSNARTFMDGIQGVLVLIFTERSGTLENMLIMSHPYPIDAVRRVTFDATFRQARIAEVEFITIAPDQPIDPVAPSMADEQDAGKQATQADERGGSVLLSIGESAGVL